MTHEEQQREELKTKMRKLGAFRNRPYRVVFIKRTTGEMRTMLCVNSKYAVRFVKGVQPKTRRVREDRAAGLRTVFDLSKFNELRNKGKDLIEAGQQSWRRIDLRSIISIEAITA